MSEIYEHDPTQRIPHDRFDSDILFDHTNRIQDKVELIGVGADL
jgi:hypothetical protein